MKQPAKKKRSPKKKTYDENRPRTVRVPIAPATMTVQEAGAYLGVSRQTAYNLAAAERLPIVRIGKRVLVVRQRLDQMLNDGSLGERDPWEKPG